MNVSQPGIGKAGRGSKGPRTKKQARRHEQRRIAEREAEKHGMFDPLGTRRKKKRDRA